MPPQQRHTFSDSYTHSLHGDMLIASHSSQSTDMYLRDNPVSTALRPPTHKPNWTSESTTVPQRGQQQQRPVYDNSSSWDEHVNNTNSGYSAEYDNTTTFSSDNCYNKYNNYHITTTKMNTPQALAAYRKYSQVYETYYTQQQEQQQQGWPSEYQTAVGHNGHNYNRAIQNAAKYPSYLPSQHKPLPIVESCYPQQEQQGRTSWIEFNNGGRYYYHTGAKPTRSSSATSLESSSTDHTRFTQGQQGHTSWIELNNGGCYYYHTGAETKANPTRSSSAALLESSSTDHTRFTQEQQQLRGQESEYQTAFGYNYQHHSDATMSHVGNHEHPEFRELPWAYTNSGLGAQSVYNTTFSNDNRYCNYYYGTATETTTPESFAPFIKSSSTYHTRFSQEQQLSGQRSGYQATFDINHRYHRATKDFVEHPSSSSSHESNLPSQTRFPQERQQDRIHGMNDKGTYSNNSPKNAVRETSMHYHLTNAHEPRSMYQSQVCQQQQQKTPSGDDAKLPAPHFGHNRDTVNNQEGYQAFEESVEPRRAHEHCFLPHQQQQVQGYEVSDHAADNGNFNIQCAIMDAARRTVDSGTSHSLCPPPAAAAPSSLSSSSIGLLLTAGYYPSDTDDDWSEWLLKEESTDSNRYPASFVRFVAYERYQVELERAQYERNQKIAARARAIEKAKIESMEKFRDKNKNKVKNTITEVLFGRL